MQSLHSRLPGLDLLRALAIVWVMLFHSFIVGGLGEDWQWLSRYGWMGVDLFFVLSGFLIGGQVLAPLARGERLSFRDFYLRRAFRILPAFAVVLVLYAAFPMLREAPGMEPWWKFAGFFVNFSIDYASNQAFSHAWSLCVEEHFYLLFPLLAWALMRKPALWKFIAISVGVMLAGIALRAGIWLHDTALDPSRNWFIEDIYYPTWSRLDGLLMGVALAAMKVFRPHWWARLGSQANWMLLGGLAILVLALWLFRERMGLLGNSIGWPVLSVGLGLLVFAGAQRNSWIGRFAIPGTGWLAAVSYSLYLSHKMAFHLVQSGLGGVLAGRGLLEFGAYAIATLSGGAFLYYTVERPFLAWRGRLSKARRMQRTLVPAS
jgi:peptidoglycan/LPS O-acetylase OafA/YrhL